MADYASFPEHAAEHILRLGAMAVPTAADLLFAGEIIRAKILERTSQGIDADGASFTPYSESYRKAKTRQLGHADTVDLFGPSRHVHMLNTLLVSVDNMEQAAPTNAPASLLQVGFWNEETARRASVHNEGMEVRTRLGSGKSGKKKKGGQALFTMPRRHFFDVNAEDVAMIERAVGLRIDERMLEVR